MPNIQQLESALKRSAELLTATEKDRDNWQKRAMQAEGEARRLKINVEMTNEQLGQVEQKLNNLLHTLREATEGA